MIDDTIKARHFKPGRSGEVTLVVLHTTENPCAAGVAHSVAAWFASEKAPEASSHYVVGPDEIVSCVDEADTAWHAPPVNDYAIGVEQTGRAAFTADDWAKPDAQTMLCKSAELVADICARHEIPIKFVDADGLLRKERGITTHVEVSRAFQKSDHTDPGPHFPLDDYLAMVQRFEVVPATDPVPASS